MKCLSLSALALTLALSAHLRADDKLEKAVGPARLGLECKSDLKKYCKARSSEIEFLPQCIAKNKAKLSKTCDKALVKYLKTQNIELEDLTTDGE